MPFRTIQITQHEAFVDAGRTIVQTAPQTYIDLDVEADGKPGYGSLLSIGAVSPWGDEFYAELKPTSERYIPKQRAFCEDHGLERDRLLVEGEDPRTALRKLAKWSIDLSHAHEKKGQVLTAFNASFDYPWIDLAMLEADMPRNPFGVAGYCIKSLAMELQIVRIGRTYDWTQTSKSNLPTEMLPEGDFTHNALEDAKYQQELHFAMLGMMEEKRQNPFGISTYNSMPLHNNDSRESDDRTREQRANRNMGNSWY